MKKILIVAASAGLLSLAACGGTTNNTTVVENTVEANVSDYNTVDANAVLPVENVVEINDTVANAM